MSLAQKTLFALALSAVFCVPARAQRVTGTFFPSAVGDIPETATPFDFTQSEDTPYLLGRVEQLSQELQFARRPYLRQLSAYANQSLIGTNGQLDTFTNGLELGFYPTDQTKMQLYYLPTIFGRAGLKRPNFFGEEFRGTFTHQPTDKFKYQTQVGLFHFAGNKQTKSGMTIVGGALGNYRFNDRAGVRFGVRRDILGNTVMSAVGLKLPVNGATVGRAQQNTIFATIDLRPTRKITTSFNYACGFVDGLKIQANGFQQLGFYVSRNLIGREQTARISYLTPSYTFLVLGYDRDMSGFGNLTSTPARTPREYIARITSAAAGQTDIPAGPRTRRAQVGGYFSPQLFYINSFRLDAAGRVLGKVYYTAGAGLGVNNAKTTFAHLNQSQLVGTANANISYRITQRVKQEHGFYFLQANTLYRRAVMYSQTTFYF